MGSWDCLAFSRGEALYTVSYSIRFFPIDAFQSIRTITIIYDTLRKVNSRDEKNPKKSRAAACYVDFCHRFRRSIFYYDRKVGTLLRRLQEHIPEDRGVSAEIFSERAER